MQDDDTNTDLPDDPPTSTPASTPALAPASTDANVLSLRIDIVSDVVCPWCLVGYRQLAIALERSDVRADIHWQPFELNPDMPPEGENLVEHVARKYGSTPAESRTARERLAAIGEELGFAFRFDDERRIVPTFRAHVLLAWANEHGREHALKMALFAAYFTDGLNVDDTEVLLDACVAVGLDREAARAALGDEVRRAAVRERERFWLAQGIRGVPAVVFDERHLVSGAQGVDNYRAILEQLTGANAASAAPS